jgi:thiol peroxidase
MRIERPDAFNFFGPRALIGPELRPGDPAPDFALLDQRLQTVTRAQFAGKPLVISVVPSLDTGVCTKQTLRFNQAAAELADRAGFIAVSADLPFAQSRWCSSNGAEHVQTLSDHREMSFGASYGTLVGDLRIESRAVFVIGPDNVVRYAEYLPSAGDEPDYEAALAALKKLLQPSQ